MFNVSQYLQKFAKIGADATRTREAVSNAIKSVCGIENASFEIQKGIVYIKEQPAVKAAVFMRKNQIISQLKSDVPKANIEDIR